ncbi:hypothetical protein FRO55_003508 [Salmonella enterica]|uniref:Uncharacterized protein n=3 Tax=Salmonella enterica TaxID=28901 RepID=A0A730SPN9_SALET|nr:hypothetical protein [Salmonella enterica subsp. enterica serovar Braenderup]EDN6887030.1 hypothetical protein [Salmonella enterica]EDS3819913.1 hypothetical protein [Salmonella enterica subsp. enterica]EDX3115891.1 hypothetical protein [Salmonella enterica subsp. enterica serovar Mississippi]EEG4909317.1 hypothetical protein [Salmonella enterica subsp. enterica serovar Mbandaka]HAE6011893.1 hypothetical protein [Salmonella enterica subsp. enterica serovar Newport]
MNEFACLRHIHIKTSMSTMARIRLNHATALKSPHEAGRRGGESIARQRWCVIIKIIV